MSVQFKARQRGLSLISMLFVGGFLAVIGVVGAQVFPTAVEYFAISKAVNKAKEGGTVDEVRRIFDRQTEVDTIKSITGKDLEISKEGDKVVVAFAYQREIHLAGPAWLLLKYEGRSK